jgi:hypothetical protein
LAADDFKKIRKALSGGEQPQRSVNAVHNGNYGKLVLTSERVLFLHNRRFSFSVEEWPLDRIEAVSFKTGMLFGEIGVRTSGSQVSSFGEFDKKEDVRIMAEAIRAAVEAARGSKSADLADLIRRLKLLHDEGVLTEDEFERAKERYLGHAPSERETMLRTLTGLSDLRKAGVLSQVEFEIKKRDFLATAN